MCDIARRNLNTNEESDLHAATVWRHPFFVLTCEHFSLHVQPAVAISPQDQVLDFQSVVIYVESLEQPLPMSLTSPEVSFKGFADVEGSMGDEWSLPISAFEDYVPPVIEEIPHQYNNQR